MTLGEESLRLHKKLNGKIATKVLIPIKDKHTLSLVYTPGVGEVSKVIASDINKVYDYTIKGHTVAIVSDGSAVLGLGNIGPEAALPVMEGKAALFKTFANLDAFPICLATQDVAEIVKTVGYLAPVFGAINLEDISAPRCFAAEEQLQDLGIPVMHDDQHGTAAVVLAGLLNASKVAGKEMKNLKVVVCGAGAAGFAITQRLISEVREIVVVDSQGIIHTDRNDLNEYKKLIARKTNRNKIVGGLKDALLGADVFVGVSKGGLFLPEYIKLMATRSIIFAMANPIPEIMPDLAKKAGAFIIATGRSDFSNQINNSLAFPGIFKGALQARAIRITGEMKQAAARAIAGLVPNPTIDKIIPDPFEKGLVDAVSKAVAQAWKG